MTTRRFGALVWAALLLAGCHARDLERARDRFYAGAPSRAADRLADAAGSHGRNQVLYLLERGTCLQAAGRLEESTAEFLKAVQRIEELERLSASRELLALWYSDVVRPYRAEPYERILARSFLMMNFFAMRQPWGAQVEARNAVALLDDRETPDWAQDPFARYLAAMAFDLAGHPENAYLEYKRVAKLRPEFPFLKAPLVRLARATGRPDDLEAWGRLPGPDSDRREGHGQIVLIAQTGVAPEKVSRDFIVPPYYRISLPAFEERPSASDRAEFRTQELEAVGSGALTDIEQVAVRTLKERAAREVAREAVRQAANEAAARALQHNLDRDYATPIVLLERIGYMIFHRADTRAWETLPAELRVGQALLPAGRHDIEIRFIAPSGGVVKTELRSGVLVKEEMPTFLIARGF